MPAPSFDVLAIADNGSQSMRYKGSFRPTGGTAPHSYAVTSGALPPGLTLGAASGNLTGVPTTGGDYAFTITVTDADGATGSVATTVRIAPKPGAFYTCIIADPASALAQMTSVAADANTPRIVIFNPSDMDAWRRQDWRVRRSTKRCQVDGHAATVELEIQNPGAAGLLAATGQYVLRWQEVMPGIGRVLALGKVQAMPNSFGGTAPTATVTIECRPDDWEAAILAYYNSVVAAGPSPDGMITVAPDGLFYDATRGPTIADFMDSTIFTPTIDARDWRVSLAPVAALVDVDPARDPGHFDGGTYGYKVYDVTTMAGEFQIRRSQENPLYKMSTKLSLSFDQRWQGIVPLAGELIARCGFVETMPEDTGGSLASFGKATWNLQSLLSSIPQVGTSVGTGWTVVSSSFQVYNQRKSYSRSPSETAVALALADGYSVVDGGEGKVGVPWSFVAPFDFRVYGDFRQRRKEEITITSTIDLQEAAIRASAPQLGANVNINDPTVESTGESWLPDTAYNVGDIKMYGGVREYCIEAHTSGETFDQSKWLALADVNADRSGASVIDFEPGIFVAKGQAVKTSDHKILISLADQVTGETTAGFYPAPTDQVFAWSAITFYAAGAQVGVAGRIYYRKTEGVSLSTWEADSSNWIEGEAGILPMSPGLPSFYREPRGQVSIKHQGVRHFAKLLRSARCLEATFRLPFDRMIDTETGFSTADLSPGWNLRVRNQKLWGSVQEVVGNIVEVSTVIDGGSGVAYVDVVLGLCPGNGMGNFGATTFGNTRFPDGYTFAFPTGAIDTTLLGVPAYSLISGGVSGPAWGVAEVAIDNAIHSATDAEDIRSKVQTIVGTSGNTFTMQMRPLVQEELLPLLHPQMNTKTFVCPKNIVLQ